VHFVPEGSVPWICTVLVVAGASTPFLVMVAVPLKLVPVAVVSTSAEVISCEPSWPPLKFWAETVNASPDAFTAVDDLSAFATFTLAPQGVAVDGCWTSDRAPAPVTPMAGSINVWPQACSDRESTSTTAALRDLANILTCNFNAG